MLQGFSKSWYFLQEDHACLFDGSQRALLDSDAGMKAADVAAKYRVSGSWVRLLEVLPAHTLAALIAAHPDRTLAELKDALATPASVPTVWRAVGLTVKKNGPPVVHPRTTLSSSSLAG